MSHSSAPLPRDEDERLRELLEYQVLDTPPEPAFDAIARIAARTFDVPIALVSLVDRERQWFKARVGLDLCETSREVAFCSHALLSEPPLVVPDAHQDGRFASNPLVTGKPHVRFYAGAPLTLPSGRRVGTLCVIDREPRSPSDADLEALRDLAMLVVDQLELRHRSALLQTHARALEASHTELESFIHAAGHDLRAPLRQLTGFGQLLGSWIRKRVGDEECVALDRLLACARRMDALVISLYQYAQSGGRVEPERVNSALIAREVIEALRLPIEQAGAQIDVSALPVVLADRHHLARVLQNLLDNALKYRGEAPPRVELSATRAESNWRFELRDNGQGMDPDQVHEAFEPFRRLGSRDEVEGSGLGLALCRRAIERCGGGIWAESKPGQGTSVFFTLPAPEAVSTPADTGRDAPGEAGPHPG